MKHFPLTPRKDDIVGREAEIKTIEECLAQGFHVTVTGPRGVGKTSLVNAIASRFPGSWYLDGMNPAHRQTLAERMTSQPPRPNQDGHHPITVIDRIDRILGNPTGREIVSVLAKSRTILATDTVRAVAIPYQSQRISIGCLPSSAMTPMVMQATNGMATPDDIHVVSKLSGGLPAAASIIINTLIDAWNDLKELPCIEKEQEIIKKSVATGDCILAYLWQKTLTDSGDAAKAEAILDSIINRTPILFRTPSTQIVLEHLVAWNIVRNPSPRDYALVTPLIGYWRKRARSTR